MGESQATVNVFEAPRSMLLSEPMGESQATVNVFEAPRSMLLSPEHLSAPFEVMDFFVESGSGALPGAASLESISEKSDAMLRQVKPSSSSKLESKEVGELEKQTLEKPLWQASV